MNFSSPLFFAVPGVCVWGGGGGMMMVAAEIIEKYKETLIKKRIFVSILIVSFLQFHFDTAKNTVDFTNKIMRTSWLKFSIFIY